MARTLRRWWRRTWHGGLHVRPEPLMTIETIEGPAPQAEAEAPPVRAALGTVAALTLGYTLALAALGTHTPPATAPAPVSHGVQYEDGSYADGYCPRGAWCDDTFPATRYGIED